MAELAGVSEDQIRRLGHWQAGAMERHYLSALPRKGMRAMAGVGSTKAGRYFLKREAIQPPDCLTRKIFPGIDELIERHGHGQNFEQTLSCIGFLKLLKEMRVFILQDSVELMEIYPDLFVWRHRYSHSVNFD